jgi:hypothetical protein
VDEQEVREQLARLRTYVEALWPMVSYPAPRMSIDTGTLPTISLAIEHLRATPTDGGWQIDELRLDEEDVEATTLWTGHGVGPCAVEVIALLVKHALRERIELIG